jgi:hypothetical protein
LKKLSYYSRTSGEGSCKFVGNHRVNIPKPMDESDDHMFFCKASSVHAHTSKDVVVVGCTCTNLASYKLTSSRSAFGKRLFYHFCEN